MVRRLHLSNAGSALVLTLVLTIAGTVGLLALLSKTGDFMRLSGVNRRMVQLKFVAEGGLKVAETDLFERGNNKDFSSVALSGHLETSDHINAGLLVGTREPIKARFVKDYPNGIQMRVYYFPTADSADASSGTAYDQHFPKTYHVISEASYPSTGAKYIAETSIQIRYDSLSELAYGILTNAKPSLFPLFDFGDKLLMAGRLHFGMDTSKIYFEGDEEFIFPKLVTFSYPTPEGQEHPFIYDAELDLFFEKGYKTNSPITLSLADAYAQALAKSTQDLSALSSSNVCLEMNCAGTVDRYLCDPSSPWPRKRYLGETPETSGSIEQTYSGDQVFTCEGCNIHIKGCYGSSISVVAENVYIEGDLVNTEQGMDSPYRLALIARNDVIIPAGVPHNNSWHDSMIFEDEIESHHTFNVTNYLPTSIDRDSGDTSYYLANRYYINPQGHKNHPDILDTDAAIYAGRTVMVEGFWHFGEFTNPDAYLMMTDVDGNRWDAAADPASGNPQSYYYIDGTETKRRADPLNCGEDVSSPADCPLGKEMLHSKMYAWRNYGALVMGEYSHLRNGFNFICCQGFWYLEFYDDPRFAIAPPVAYPHSGRIMIQRLWQKDYPGRSSTLSAHGL